MIVLQSRLTEKSRGAETSAAGLLEQESRRPHRRYRAPRAVDGLLWDSLEKRSADGDEAGCAVPEEVGIDS